MQTETESPRHVGSSALLGVKREYEEAAKRLAAATEAAFPIGTVIAVTLGKSRIVGEVVRAGGCWWSRPAQVVIRNLKSGKQRNFSATYEGHAVEVITPNAELSESPAGESPKP